MDWILQARILEKVFHSPGDLPNPAVEPRCPSLTADSLPPESHGYCHLIAKSCLTLLAPHGLQPARLLSQWNFPSKNTGVGCLSFSRRSSWPTNWIRVSRIVDRGFTVWATRKSIYLYIFRFIQILTSVSLSFIFSCFSILFILVTQIIFFFWSKNQFPIG